MRRLKINQNYTVLLTFEFKPDQANSHDLFAFYINLNTPGKISLETSSPSVTIIFLLLKFYWFDQYICLHICTYEYRWKHMYEKYLYLFIQKKNTILKSIKELRYSLNEFLPISIFQCHQVAKVNEPAPKHLVCFLSFLLYLCSLLDRTCLQISDDFTTWCIKDAQLDLTLLLFPHPPQKLRRWGHVLIDN